MNRHDINSCPIKLANLTFNCFTEYLLSLRPKKKKKKRRKRKRTGVVNEAESGGESESSIGSESEKKKYLSKSTYGSSRSALMHLYRGCGAKMSDTFQNELANFMRGMKRKVAKQKEDLGTKADEGKTTMSFQVYELLCKLMMESEDDEYIFGHCFLTLKWNLMAQSDNVVQSHVNHLE